MICNYSSLLMSFMRLPSAWIGLKSYANNCLCPVTYRQYRFKDVLVASVTESDKSRTSVGRE